VAIVSIIVYNYICHFLLFYALCGILLFLWLSWSFMSIFANMDIIFIVINVIMIFGKGCKKIFKILIREILQVEGRAIPSIANSNQQYRLRHVSEIAKRAFVGMVIVLMIFVVFM
jgi:hypothetical protein